MKFIVAGVVLLFAFFVGVFSTVVTPRIDTNDEKVNKATLAAEFHTFFVRKNAKQIVLLAVLSLLCSALSFVLLEDSLLTLQFVKFVTVLLVLFSALLIDYKLHIIPNFLVFVLLGVGLVSLGVEFFTNRQQVLYSLIASFSGLAVCLVVFYILARLTKNGMGFGDVKLISAIGFVLGLSHTIALVMFSLIVCCVVAIFLMLTKKKNRNDSLPFAPFMFFGYYLHLLLISLM